LFDVIIILLIFKCFVLFGERSPDVKKVKKKHNSKLKQSLININEALSAIQTSRKSCFRIICTEIHKNPTEQASRFFEREYRCTWGIRRHLIYP
jgi:hypothetical protein